LPHPYPSDEYTLGANNGNEKAVKLRTNCDAAVAELVWSGYASITYAWMGWPIICIPKHARKTPISTTLH
jgi:hypothetical protein